MQKMHRDLITLDRFESLSPEEQGHVFTLYDMVHRIEQLRAMPLLTTLLVSIAVFVVWISSLNMSMGSTYFVPTLILAAILPIGGGAGLFHEFWSCRPKRKEAGAHLRELLTRPKYKKALMHLMDWDQLTATKIHEIVEEEKK